MRQRAFVLLGLTAVLGGVLLAVTPVPARADGVRDAQWQINALRARTAWKFATGAGVTVAVVDSGVDAGHPDLAGQVLPGADFVDRTTDGRRDPVGHGTSVAAFIAGRADDRRGVVGLAHQAKILPVRVLDQRNRYEDAAVVAEGLRWAVDRGAKVVNLSLGGAGRSEALAMALVYAFEHDVVVIACGGNTGAGGGTEVWYPAREPGVVAVAGITQRGGYWQGSLAGHPLVLSAPASVLVAARPGGYWRVQGTSFAAPMVTAAATLIRARFPEMSAANVINRLIRTARDLGPTGRDARYGYGVVDPVRALTADVAGTTENPLRPREAAAPTESAAAASTSAPPVAAAVPDARPPVRRSGLPLTTLGIGVLGAAGLVLAIAAVRVGRVRRSDRY